MSGIYRLNFQLKIIDKLVLVHALNNQILNQKIHVHLQKKPSWSSIHVTMYESIDKAFIITWLPKYDATYLTIQNLLFFIIILIFGRFQHFVQGGLFSHIYSMAKYQHIVIHDVQLGDNVGTI